jgi:iron complex outermembrane recepter protein
MRKFMLKAVVSAVGIGFGTAALAQSEIQPSPSTSDTLKSDSTALGRVVVTAQRRNELLAQTPIAASVLSGTELAEKGVVNADALQFVSPSVAVNNYGQGTEFNIRGIGKAEMNSLSTTGVITYRDGVPSFPGYFQGEPYFDISNIQLLRGPQGTVVGQNSTGGAVFVNTNNPIIGGDYTGYVSASTGNYNSVGLQGALNLPISDVLAARIAVFDERRSSFYTIVGPNGAAYNGNIGDVHQRAARLSILMEPTDKLRVLWKTDTDDLDMGAYVASQPQSTTPVLPGATSIRNNDLFTVSANTPQEARDTFSRHSLKVEYELDSGTKLRSVTGYGNGTTKWVSDFDGGAALSQTSYVKGSETQVSQEFNIISSEKEVVTWLVGAFSIHNTYDFPSSDGAVKIDYTGYNLPSYNYQFDGNISQDSQALFGQVGYAITPDIKLDVGGRNTSNSSTNSLNIKQLGVPIAQNQSTSEQNTSYKVSLGWKVNPNNFIYATQSTGFKPGGINLQTTPTSPASTFDKEENKSLEIGLKSAFAGGKGGLTLTGFYNEYKGFQVTTASPAGALFPVITNVTGTTVISGLEAEANYKIGGWTLGGGFGLANSSLGQFYAVDSRGTASSCNQNSGPATATCVNLAGRQLSYAPQLTYNVSAKYDIAVWDGKLTTAINFGHVDSQWATLFENAAKGDSLAERNILNAQMTYQRGKTALTVYGTNLTNQQYVAAHWLASSTSLDFAGPPRQYGVKVTQAF